MKKIKKKLKKTGISINENIRLTENISYNSLLLDKIDFYTFPLPLTFAELNAAIDEVKNSVDSMSELGETESLRLQMALDRLSKLVQTLSNIMKKINDTQETIVQNLKG